MTKKLGDVAIAITVLVFIVSAFSLFINEADDVTSTSNNYASSSLSGLDTTLRANTSDMEQQFTDKLDNTSALDPNTDSDNDNTGYEAGGILNILSKNILVSFVKESSEKMGLHPVIVGFVLSIIAIIISVLLMRMVLSEGRI